MSYKFWGQSDLSFLEYFSLRHLGKTLWISFRNFNWGAIQVNQSVHKSRDLEYSRCDSRSIKCFEFQYFRSSFREISTTYWIYVCRVTNIITHNTINKAWVPSNYHQILIIIKNKKTQCSWVLSKGINPLVILCPYEMDTIDNDAWHRTWPQF